MRKDEWEGKLQEKEGDEAVSYKYKIKMNQKTSLNFSWWQLEVRKMLPVWK